MRKGSGIGSRDCNPYLVRTLINLYTGHSVRVLWAGISSTDFQALNGVISPVLFCVYTDYLLIRLSESGLGCYLGFNFVGALCSLDRLHLLCAGCCRSVINTHYNMTLSLMHRSQNFQSFVHVFMFAAAATTTAAQHESCPDFSSSTFCFTVSRSSVQCALRSVSALVWFRVHNYGR